MRHLSDENKLQVDKKNKNRKIKKKMITNNIKNFKTNRYKLTASRNIIHSILNSRLMRPLSILQLQKKIKNRKVKKFKEKFRIH